MRRNLGTPGLIPRQAAVSTGPRAQLPNTILGLPSQLSP